MHTNYKYILLIGAEQVYGGQATMHWTGKDWRK